MSGSYPRLGGGHRFRDTQQKKCDRCGGRAVRQYDIQVSWFRGEDVVVKVCDVCAKADLNELVRLAK